MRNRKVIIIGAGIGGLVAGYWLGKRGCEVEILEASDRPGGRMVTLEHRGDRVDVGAQFYHTNMQCAVGFIDELGMQGLKRAVSGKILHALQDGTTYVYDERYPYARLFGLRGNLKLYWFVLRYILFGPRITPFRIAENHPAYDDAAVLDLYRSPSDRALRDYLVTPLCNGAGLSSPECMSLYHYIRMFRLALMSSFFGLARGVHSLAEELARQLPVKYEAPVEKLVLEKGRVAGVQTAGDGSVRKAGHVIVAVTPPAAAGMMPEEFAEQRSFFDSVLYSPLPMPVFFLDRPLRGDTAFYFSDPCRERAYTFAIDAHAKIPEMCPSGKSTVTGWAVYPKTLDMMEQDDDTILKTAREDIELMIPGFSGWIEEATVHRHSFVNAVYPSGAYRRILDFQDKARDLQGVSFVSSVLCGMSIEAAMRSGADAVRRVCGWGGMV